MSTLKFDDLRSGNVARLPEFKNGKGLPAHDKSDGSDWPLDAWSNAVAGEAGELCNITKKVRRGDLTIEEARESIGKELADIICYADITAMQVGLDLGDIVRAKFNEVSDRIGCDVKI